MFFSPPPLTAGIGYGLYLTLSSWALYYVATHTDFFEDQLGMFSLEETNVRAAARLLPPFLFNPPSALPPSLLPAQLH